MIVSMSCLTTAKLLSMKYQVNEVRTAMVHSSRHDGPNTAAHARLLFA